MEATGRQELHEATMVRQLRLQRGLSVRGLAKLSGLSPSSVHAIELGYRKMQDVSRYKLAQVFGVSPEELK